MRRAVARGRLFPQSYSTDRRYGRLSLKACALFPLMWANADDQGRLPGHPEEIKYATCPNIDHITKADIPELLEELDKNKLIKVYSTSETQAIQMLDWWGVQRLQWAWPSDYPPPEGWQDRLRYKKSAHEVITENWGSPESSPEGSPENSPEPSPEPSPETSASPHWPSAEKLGSEIRSRLMALPQAIDRLVEHEVIKDTLAQMAQSRQCLAKSEVTTDMGRIDLVWEDLTGEVVAAFEIDTFWPKKKSITKLKALNCPHPFVILRSNPEPLQWEQGVPLIGLCKERESTKEKESENKEEIKDGRGRGISPEPSGENPSPSLTGLPLQEYLTETFPQAFGRKPNSREVAQLRDLGKEISSAGGATAEQVHDAFKEACGQNKFSVSYVRAILLDWLGVPRAPP